MKKVGILFGMEDTFPWAFIDRVNQLGNGEVVAEAVQINELNQGEDYGYAVIIDRISQDVPFYRAFLKNAALTGTNVINNPFWWSADDKFFNNALADTLGVPLPNTVILPSAEHPTDTTGKSFRNLKYPMDWEGIFEYIGFPAYMKPYAGGGWKNVYRLENKEEFWQKHQETGQLVMMLQEEIIFQDYYRVYCLGCKDVLIMPYEPRNPHHLRYVVENPNRDKKLMAKIKEYTLTLCKGLGYDFNTVEFAVRDGIPYAIDFGNPAPDAEYTSVGPENFEWVVETSAKMAIAAAKKQKDGQVNLTWGTFIKNAAK